MPPSPTGSFIPKRNPGSRQQTVRRYNFFLLPMISYALFMASLLASAALFIYQISVNKQFSDAVENLQTQITSFNDEDLDRVVEFDDRLELSTKLVKSHVSLASLLTILENATADTVQFKNLTVTRKNNTTLTAEANLVTTALDGVLFQKSTYKASTLLASSSLTGVTVAPEVVPGAEAAEGAAEGTPEEPVSLKAEFIFDADKILYVPVGGAVTEDESTTDSTDADESVSTTTAKQTTP